MIDRLDEIAREKHGVVFLGLPWMASFNVWLTKPIETLDDLKAMKTRSLPVYDAILKGLGVPTAVIPFGDIYTALERGTVDAACYPYHDVITFGWEKVVKYRLDPPFWRVAECPYLMNLQSYEALPEDLRKILMDNVIQLEKDVTSMYDAQSAEEWQQLKAAGMQSIRLTDEEWFRTQQLDWEEAQKIMVKISPEHGQEMLQLVSQFYPPKEPYPVID